MTCNMPLKIKNKQGTVINVFIIELNEQENPKAQVISIVHYSIC